MSVDIRKVKAGLREKYKEIRKDLQKDKLKKRDLDIELQSRFLTLAEYNKCDIIYIYVAKDIEVQTRGIINAAFANGKKVAVPRCIAKEKKMEFYFITSMDQLRQGTYGLLEPVPDICEKVLNDVTGLCIVPGLAFDGRGYRLGFGMGYYDRFLSKFQGKTVGLCYSSCVCWKLPHGFFDRSVDILITEHYTRYLDRSNEDEQ